MAWVHHCLWGLFVYLRQKAYTLGHHVREVSMQNICRSLGAVEVRRDTFEAKVRTGLSESSPSIRKL